MVTPSIINPPAQTGIISCIIGVGHYLPEHKLDNDALAREKNIDTSDEWIFQRSGIRHRHFAAADEACSDLGAKAAQAALEQAGISPDHIDLIIVATTTPDHIFPATATKIQAKLQVPPCPAFDVQAVCSGFIFALNQADNMLRLGQATRALVIGAETYSRILNWQDRSTCVLFGDGAGAVVLEASRANNQAEKQSGLIDHFLQSDGSHYDRLFVDGGAGSTGQYGHVTMDGKDVFRHAVHKMSDAVNILCEKHHITANQLDWLVPHQANARIIEKVGERLNIDPNKVIITVQDHANTSAATIPIALCHGAAHDKFKKGDLIALTALGGGFSWGASLLRW
ncbi:MAG: beta-ketoacyl-ACP synthase III [Alphaproteobacteria bacterium]